MSAKQHNSVKKTLMSALSQTLTLIKENYAVLQIAAIHCDYNTVNVALNHAPRNLLTFNALQTTFQEVAFCTIKGRLSCAERLPFAGRKVAFCFSARGARAGLRRRFPFCVPACDCCANGPKAVAGMSAALHQTRCRPLVDGRITVCRFLAVLPPTFCSNVQIRHCL